MGCNRFQSFCHAPVEATLGTVVTVSAGNDRHPRRRPRPRRPSPERRPAGPAPWVAAAVGVVALTVGLLLPLVSPLLVALVAGILVANLVAPTTVARWHDPALTRTVLRAGIVLLGLRLSLAELGELGGRGVVVVVAVVAVTFGATCWIGSRMRLDRGLVVLVAAGFSVCGAAAIAAVESGVRRRSADVAVAIALVTLFGTLMIPLVPAAASALGLSQVEAGVWAGASVHEVAQVVAAASFTGPAALAAATTIKLTRVALLGVVFVASRWFAGERDDSSEGARPPFVPLFVWGFLGAVALRTADVLPGQVLEGADLLTTFLLAAAMFGLGLTVTLSAVRTVERRATWLALVATVVATVLSLGLAVALF